MIFSINTKRMMMSDSRIMCLVDEFGVIREAHKVLPRELVFDFLAALAELEDRDCHAQRTFPHTRLHKVKGVQQPIYRADITKISG